MSKLVVSNVVQGIASGIATVFTTYLMLALGCTQPAVLKSADAIESSRRPLYPPDIDVPLSPNPVITPPPAEAPSTPPEHQNKPTITNPNPTVPMGMRQGHGFEEAWYTDESVGITVGAYILTQSYRWGFGSSEKIVQPSGESAPDFRTFLKEHLAPGLRQVAHIIAVGTASCEGQRGSEVERAGKRAETLRNWIVEALPEASGEKIRSRSTYIVNLGQHKSHSCVQPKSEESTSDQRRVVIMYLETDSSHGEGLPDPDKILDLVRKLHQMKTALFDPDGYSQEFRLAGKERIPFPGHERL